MFNYVSHHPGILSLKFILIFHTKRIFGGHLRSIYTNTSSILAYGNFSRGVPIVRILSDKESIVVIVHDQSIVKLFNCAT